MKKLSILLMFFLIFITISIPNIDGETVSLDPTTETDGEDTEVILIGDILYNYTVEIDVTNTHEYCLITVGLGEYYSFPYIYVQSFFKTEIGPGDNELISWTNNYTYTQGQIDNVGIEITAHLNKTVYNDLQTDVVMDYQISVFDDRGNPITSPDDDVNTTGPDDDVNTTSLNDEYEPNDSLDSPYLIGEGKISGSVSKNYLTGNDNDYFSIQVPPKKDIVVTVKKTDDGDGSISIQGYEQNKEEMSIWDIWMYLDTPGETETGSWYNSDSNTRTIYIGVEGSGDYEITVKFTDDTAETYETFSNICLFSIFSVICFVLIFVIIIIIVIALIISRGKKKKNMINQPPNPTQYQPPPPQYNPQYQPMPNQPYQPLPPNPPPF